MENQNTGAGYGGGMDRAGQTTNPASGAAAGAANTPPFGTPEPPAVRTAADHQIPPDTGTSTGRGMGQSETERELERTRDMLARTAAPVMAEKTQEAISETADRIAHSGALGDQVKRTASAMAHDAERAVEQKVQDRVSQGMERAASGLETAARKLDDMANRQGMGATGTKAKAVNLAHGTADTMESVSRYLRSNDAADLQRDMERQVRENPLQTLLVGVAAGWLIGKILR